MKLDVYLDSFAEPVGVLEVDHSESLRFHYSPSYLAQKGAHQLSIQLPLDDEIFSAAKTRVFFANLLPEGHALEELAARHSIDVDDLANLLFHAGAECAGAVSVVPQGSARPKNPGLAPDDYIRQSEEDVSSAIAALARGHAPNPETFNDVSLAGVQRKTAVYIDDSDVVFRAKQGVPTTHIIKVGDSKLDDHVDNEAFCLGIARRLGFATVDAKVSTVGTTKYLTVGRYDRNIARRADKRLISRVHQEDFAQALGFPPRRKYSHHDGPTSEMCFTLGEFAVEPAIFRRDLLRAFILTFLLGNSDGHAKNFSILYASEGARLAPLYDIFCVQLYDHYRRGMALSIGGQQEYERIDRDAWKRFAAKAHFRISYVEQEIETLAKDVVPVARAVASEHPFPGRVVDRVVAAIGYQVRLLNDAFDFRIEVDTPPFITTPGGWPGPSG